jgi:ectoine hydroxylase-related dioxygenase (phytanoyl-CoA dioxygenase family)
MTAFAPSEDDVSSFERDGYLLINGFFRAEVIRALREAAHRDRALDAASYGRADGEGGVVRLSVWNHPTDTLYGAIARSRSLVEMVEALLGGEVYHYHSKMIMKDARVGGAWAWHQDYGYWYQNGVLYPNLASAFIAVDPARRENGCLQVIRGSHLLGRLDHKLTGEQAGIDPERIAAIETRLETVYVEMDPGDVLFFHANTLHRSDQNHSDQSRWSMICCYNRADNDPYRDSHHPRYTPLEKLSDDGVMSFCGQEFDSADAASFLRGEEDASSLALGKGV